jgi:peptidoglycan hydrolase-like protein with peptidoglycan-binding domain
VKKLIIVMAAASLLGLATSPVAAQQPAANQKIAGLDMSAVPDLERDGVREVQTALRAKDFDPGPIDGVVGPRTREAVRSFQNRYGMKPTGVIDNQTLFAVGHADVAISAAR